MDKQMMTGEIQGFGESTLAELAELRKALDIGYTQPVTGQGSDALRVESLEATLKLLTYQQVNLRLWNLINKDPAYSTVEEFNRLLSYGPDRGAFVASGVLPEEEDSTYERADQKVKYLGTTRVVNHPATLVRTVPADLIGRETMNGALWLLGKLNSALYDADAENNPLEFNGVPAQMIDGGSTVIDARGGPLTQDMLENAAQISVENFGMATKVFSNPRIFTDFAKQFYGLQRFPMQVAPGNVAGTPITGFQTINGRLDFEPDIFVKAGQVPAGAATSAKAPTAPTAAFAVNLAPQAGSQFATADAGVYKYQVSAINAYGESLPSALSAGQTVAAGDSVSITITDGGGTYGATAYRIYRTAKGGATTSFMVTAARAKTGGSYTSPTVVVDLNAVIPGTFKALVLDMTEQSLTFKQLSPMIKMDLAIISPAIRWMQLLYGTPIVYAPKKNILIKNIGTVA